MIHTEIVQSGKYQFKITRNILLRDEIIIVHTYKVGGDYTDCVNISYFYKNNKPYKVAIPHLLYEPECAISTTLEQGGGSEIMIKIAIRYAYNEVKSLPNFEFQDSSHIDCIDKDLTKVPPRKTLKPLNLAYFYIAYHGMTWYEARFNAEMKDKIRYKLYRERLEFLVNPVEKPTYEKFRGIIGSTIDSVDLDKYLEKLYNKANTYREFFEAIPKSKRCDVLYPWLNTFIEHYIGDVYSVKDWLINVHTMDNKKSTVGGSLKKGRNYRIFSYIKMHSLAI
jgi:hypothetical protein